MLPNLYQAVLCYVLRVTRVVLLSVTFGMCLEAKQRNI
jgi:hypothetical protein